ncbi:MAG: tetratricopeptide repeat protein [Fibrobacteria bacterium]
MNRANLTNRALLPALLCLAACLSGCGGDLKRARESYRVGDYARALRLYQAELDRHPASSEARFGYAVVLQEISTRKKDQGKDDEKDWAEVVQAYEVCARLGDSATIAENYGLALFHLANKLYLKEDYGNALEYLETARRADPKNKYVLNLTGIVQYSLGKYQDAQETFEYIIAEDPGFVSAYLNLGNVLWESGNEDAALVTWKQALTVSPENKAVISRVEAALKKIAGP